MGALLARQPDRPPVPLLGDRDPRVRRAAAANPLLPLDLVESLLDEAESAGAGSVDARSADARSVDADLAEGAAANPALSAPRLHALLDRAGVAAAARQ